MPVLNLFVLLLFSTFLWSQNSFGGPLHENVTVTLNLSGDLVGKFELSGPLNQVLKSESEAGGCEAQVLFRKVTTKGRIMLEVWPAFNCTRDGQKKSFKLHRKNLDPAKEVQNIEIKYLDEKTKNLILEFRDLSLQKGK